MKMSCEFFGVRTSSLELLMLVFENGRGIRVSAAYTSKSVPMKRRRIPAPGVRAEFAICTYRTACRRAFKVCVGWSSRVPRTQSTRRSKNERREHCQTHEQAD